MAEAESDWESVLSNLKDRPAWEEFGRSDRRQRKMDRIDALSPSVKAVVHDFGWLTVKTMLEAGVTDGKKMRNLIHTVLMEHSNEYRSHYAPRKHT